MKINVNWITGEDYDVEVYRKNADGTLGDQVGSSGNAPGKPEEVVLTRRAARRPGTYVLRVVYFAAASRISGPPRSATTSDVRDDHRSSRGLHADLRDRRRRRAEPQVYHLARRALVRSAPVAAGASGPVVHPGSDGLAKAGPPPNWPYAE